MFKTLLAEACLRESKPTCCSPTESKVDGVMACCDKSFCSEGFSHLGGAGNFSVFVALRLLMNYWTFLSSSPLRRLSILVVLSNSSSESLELEVESLSLSSFFSERAFQAPGRLSSSSDSLSDDDDVEEEISIHSSLSLPLS